MTGLSEIKNFLRFVKNQQCNQNMCLFFLSVQWLVSFFELINISQYNSLNVKLLNSQHNKLKLSI